MAKSTSAGTMTVEDLLSSEFEAGNLKTLPFEEGTKLLEALVASVEAGTLSLDKSLLAYERGVQLVEQLRGLLSGAEEKVRLLQRPVN